MIASFPILQLPPKVLYSAIRCMTPEEIINFSLISKFTLQTAESLNLQDRISSIEIHELVSIEICNCRINWTPSDVNLQKLIDHIKCVFHTHQIYFLRIHTDSHNWKSIHEALDSLNCSRTSLYNQSDDVWFQKIVNQFSGSSLCLYTDLNSIWHNQIMSTNRRNLYISTSCTELLSVNCTHLHVNQRVRAVDANILLRHWIRGAFQSLKTLHFSMGADAVSKLIFKGVEVQEACEKDIKDLKNVYLRNVRNIYRHDGTRATVVFKYGHVKMHVWK